jgi:uncharacterized protein YebE (UPF0316 family)
MTEFMAMLPPIAVCFMVCACKILEISIQSLKTVMMVKGQRFKAALLGFVECVIWGLVISSVISTLGDNLLLLFFYCFGYACGLYIGSTLEGKIALGTSCIELTLNDKNTERVKKYLQDNGRGYTVFAGQGSKEKVNKISIILPRKEVRPLISEIKILCNNEVFVTISDISKSSGGYGISGNTK